MRRDASSAAAAPRRERTRRVWFGVVAILVSLSAFLFVAVGGIGENLVYYWGPTEVLEAGDEAVGATVRLGGQVAPGSIVFGRGVSDLEFDVTDGRATVHVAARGVPPQMFREGIGVVVEGTMSEAGTFLGDRLLVAHDNEYQAPPAGEDVEMEELIETTRGLGEGAGR